MIVLSAMVSPNYMKKNPDDNIMIKEEEDDEERNISSEQDSSGRITTRFDVSGGRIFFRYSLIIFISISENYFNCSLQVKYH